MEDKPKRTNKVHRCSMCKRDAATWDDPAEATGLFVGTMWNEYSQRVMPIRAYLCDMHADQAESGSFVRQNRVTITGSDGTSDTPRA